MGAPASLLGVALLLVALVDMLWTTVWVSGSAGPITGSFSSLGWRLVRKLSRGNHTVMSLYGPASIVGAIVTWSGLLWLGWALVFSGDPNALRDTHTGIPGDWVDVVYFTGYSIFTMGNGDLTPVPELRIATVLMNASGLILLTLAVSYLLSIVSAVVDMRAFALRVSAVAAEPVALVRTVLAAGGPSALDTFLNSRHAELARLTAQHAAYPVLRYFHPVDRNRASPPAVVSLDESLTLMEAVLPAAQRPSPIVVGALRGVTEDYLRSMGIDAPASLAVPPTPAFAALAVDGVHVSADEAGRIYQQHEDRRRELRALLDHYGWDWR